MKYLTLGQAEREVGVTKSTISRAIKDGRLSATRNELGHYQIDPAELFRVYPPSMQQAERNTTQQPLRNTDEHNMLPWLRDRLEQTEQKLQLTEHELAEKSRALEELRDAYNELPSPEDFEAKLKLEVDRIETEKHKAIALQKQQLAEKSEKWKTALAERKRQIEQARAEAQEISQQRDQEREARELLSQKLSELETRGFFARLFNRKPKSAVT